MGKGFQDQQQQAGQGLEHGTQVILGAVETSPVHGMGKKTASVQPLERERSFKILIQDEKLRRLPSHPLHETLGQPTKIASSTKALTTRTRNCAGNTKTLRTHQQSCWQVLFGDPIVRQTYKCFWVYHASPQRNSSLENSETSPMPWSPTGFLIMPGRMSTLMGLLTKVCIWQQIARCDNTSPRVHCSLQCSNYWAEILAMCTAAEHLLECGKPMGNIAIFVDFLSIPQALHSAYPNQMIQGLHLPSWQLCTQYLSSGCLHMVEWQGIKQQTDSQKLGVRLCRHWTLLPSERSRHSSTHGSKDTGRKTLLVIRHTVTWLGGLAQQITIFTCEQGAVVLMHIWRGLAFQTVPPVNADKLTKPWTTSLLPKICWERSANLAAWCWSGDQAMGLGRGLLPNG